MNTYTPQFYDLLSRALGGNTSNLLQGYLDDVMATKYNQLQLDGFILDPEMQIDFTGEQIQKELHMNVMATYVDIDSKPIPLGTEGFKLQTFSIPRMKQVEYYNEDKIRKQLIADKLLGDMSGDRALTAAKNKLFITLDDLIGGHTNSLTYQRHQMVSNGGLTLTEKNNPRGIRSVTFSASIPDGNKTSLSGTKRWWTNKDMTTEGSAADPVGDMKAMVKAARNKGVVNMHFEMDELYAQKVLSHSKIIEAIAINQYFLAADKSMATAAVAQLADDIKLQILGRIVGAPIKTIDSVVSVEVFNEATKELTRPQFRAFNDNVIVLIPDGTIGSVKTVIPIQFAGGVQGYMYDGRLLVNVYYDYAQKTQAFETEMTCLAVPSMPQYMWYLHPYSA